MGLSFAVSAAASTLLPGSYYVAVGGSDTADGSFEKPMRTIDKALSLALPGDTVFVRGGVYHQRVSFPRSGEADRRIVLTAYKNEIPILSGAGMDVGNPDAMIRIGGVDHITVCGFEVAHFMASKSGTEPNGIVADGGASNVTISRNHIHHVQNNVSPYQGGGGAHAILVIGNAERPMRNIVVEQNVVHDCKTGFSENVTINGYVDGFVVRANVIYDCANIGIDAAGGYWGNPNPALNYARNGVISENTVYNIEFSRGLVQYDYGAIGIYADGSRNITIERNRVFHCDRGIGIVSENDDFPTTGCIVRNNLIYDCWLSGIFIGGYLGYTGGGTENCYIVNNTLYGNNRVKGYFAETEGEIRLTEHCRNNVICNNLVCTTHSGDLFVHKYTTTGSGNTFDCNHYSGPGMWMWEQKNSNPITVFEIWQHSVSGDAGAMYQAVPLFRDAKTDIGADFGIGPESPVKNRGKILPGAIHGALDFEGNPRFEQDKISIGAIQ